MSGKQIKNVASGWVAESADRFKAEREVWFFSLFVSVTLTLARCRSVNSNLQDCSHWEKTPVSNTFNSKYNRLCWAGTEMIWEHRWSGAEQQTVQKRQQRLPTPAHDRSIWSQHTPSIATSRVQQHMLGFIHKTISKNKVVKLQELIPHWSRN